MSLKIGLTHDHLPTSRKALVIERALARVYIRIFEEIKDSQYYPRDMGNIRTLYNNFLYNQTRKAIQKVYETGSDYAEKVTGVAVFFSKVDETIISNATKTAVESYWNKVSIIANRDLRNLHKLELNPDAQDLEPEFDSDHSMTVGAISVTASTLAIATIAKIRQITESPSKGQIQVAAILGSENPAFTPANWKWVWSATIDEKTCDRLPDGRPGCNSLNGEEWAYDDFSSIPVPGLLPPEGTHPNCRCRPLLKKGDTVQMF